MRMLIGLGGSTNVLVVRASLFAVAALVAFVGARRLRVSRDSAPLQAGAALEASMTHGTFATAICCIDGRVQSPVADWLKINGSVRYVDAVTIPGPDKALTHGHEERR